MPYSTHYEQRKEEVGAEWKDVGCEDKWGDGWWWLWGRWVDFQEEIYRGSKAAYARI